MTKQVVLNHGYMNQNKVRVFIFIKISLTNLPLLNLDHKTLFQDKLVFWFFLYLHPIAWITLAVLSVITFSAFEVKPI